MAFNKTQIIEKLTQRPAYMLEADRYYRKMRMHVYGIGYKEELARINHYENAEQQKAREEHAISNKAEVGNLLMPVEKIWSAKGGSTNQLMNDSIRNEKLRDAVSSKNNGVSLFNFIRNQFFNAMITDPNGVTLFEYDQKTITPKYKPCTTIWDYELDGISVNWIIFFEEVPLTDAEKNERKTVLTSELAPTKRLITYIDKDEMYTGVYLDGVLTDTNNGVSKNKMKRVPAIVNSPLYDQVRNIRISTLDLQVELLDRLLISNSILSINEFFYNFIRGWEYAEDCPTCNGEGVINSQRNPGETIECPTCHGLCLKSSDVSDVFLLRPPKSKDDPQITQPFGFIYPPTDAWKYQTESIEGKRNFMFYSHWGTTYEQGEQSNTATGRFIDVNSVDNRLDAYANIIENAHNQFLEIISIWLFRNTDGINPVKYGRRFMIEAPDVIWDKYLEAKTKNAPQALLDTLLSNYIESEYKDNTKQLVIFLKLMRVEPFLHYTIDQVMTFPIDPKEKLSKMYFNEWISQMNDVDLLKLTSEELRLLLIKFITSKTYVEPKLENDETKQ